MAEELQAPDEEARQSAVLGVETRVLGQRPERVLEVAHERAGIRLAPEALVGPGHGLADQVLLGDAEGGQLPVLDADLEEGDDVLDEPVVEPLDSVRGASVDHLAVGEERADGRVERDVEVRPPEDPGEPGPAPPVVDQDGVLPGEVGVQDEGAGGERLPGAGVGAHEAVEGVPHGGVEEPEAEERAERRREEAVRRLGAAPGLEDGEEVGGVPGGAALPADGVARPTGEHRQEAGQLGHVLDQELGVARRAEGLACALGPGVQLVQGARVQEQGDRDVGQLGGERVQLGEEADDGPLRVRVVDAPAGVVARRRA